MKNSLISCLIASLSLAAPAWSQETIPQASSPRDSGSAGDGIRGSSLDLGLRQSVFTNLQSQLPMPSANGGSSNEIVVNTAQVVCEHKVQVAAQSDGLISELLVDEGSVVKKGDVLLKIDSRVATAELAVAEKEMESAIRTAEQTANVDYAKAAAEVSREEYEAERELWQKGATTYSVLKRKRLEAERAIYGVDVAEVEHENNGLAADVAREKVRAAKVNLELFEVVAPYDGIIVQRLRDQGEWTRAGEPILRLVSMDEMKVEAIVSVDEIQSRGRSLAQLEKAPLQVEVTLIKGSQDNRPYQHETSVDFVSPEIDSGMVTIFSRIPNVRLGDGPWTLRDGMTATVRIQLP